jgi:putative tryptophan/tyrosine transport system substrate-binding protein
VKRRKFISMVGGAAAWPLAVRAQQPAMPVIGFLSSNSTAGAADSVTALRAGLKETGFVEGQNVAVEYRFADSQVDRLPALAADLVRRQVSVIFAVGGGVTAQAAKAATSIIPIVFAHGEDPVRIGLVPSLSRLSGNLTGVTFFTVELAPKRLELLRELVPGARTIALLVNPSSTNADNLASLAAVEALVRAGKQQPLVLQVARPDDLVPAFARLVEQRADGLLIISDTMFGTYRNQITALAARHTVPAIYMERAFVTAGGLISYGASRYEAWRKAGNYVGEILKGAKPADLPVLQPTRFELVINMGAAKALGLTVPLTLQVAADEVLE